MKIGLLSVGLNTYWLQFEGLLERLDGYRNTVKARIKAHGNRATIIC